LFYLQIEQARRSGDLISFRDKLDAAPLWGVTPRSICNEEMNYLKQHQNMEDCLR
jgi:hypothetical protein